MDGSAFVESEPVTNDGDDAHRARGVSLFRLRQQQQQRPIIRDRSGTSPRLCRAVNRSNASASKRAMSPKKKRIGRLNTSTILFTRIFTKPHAGAALTERARCSD